MSARSSSGSWSGGGGAPPDIIDLDKYMRGAVRPSRPETHPIRCDQLVVDAGGVDRKPGGALSGALVTSPAPATAASSSSGSRPPPHAKRFSHDSGLSDGSYARRKHRPHRRAAAGGEASAAPAGSSNSLRAFRAVCERALLDQQAQIARVAQLCERLSERPRRRSEPSDSSDVSSSSRSTRDQRRRDKHRTDECKTYKIIMNKLDELNRLFAARARSPAPRPPRPAPAPSSGSVSVSDKLVATEPERRREHTVQVAHNTVARGGGEAGPAPGPAPGPASGPAPAPAAARLAGLRAVANTCALDIPPRDALPTPAHRPNIATESVVQCESRAGTGSSGGDPRCGFDLDDPVHLYSQAKRLQALAATTRRARSVEPAERSGERAQRFEHFEHCGERLDEPLGERLDERLGERLGERRHARLPPKERARDTSLCALCRGYWRALRHYLAAQIFCYPDATCS